MHRPVAPHRPSSFVCRVLCFSALAVGGLAQAAGPSQGSAPVPGGFVSACASEISAGVTYTPGLDLTAGFAGWPGRYACSSETFTGAAGVAAAEAQWSATYSANGAQAQAEMGRIRLAADSLGRSDQQFPTGVAGGGWNDRMVVSLDGHAGEAAVWTFQMLVDGSFTTDSGTSQVMMNAYRNHTELSNTVAGFDRGDSDGFTTDRQRVRWAMGGNGTRTVDDVVTFAVPIILGQAFDWGVYGTIKASIGNMGPPSSAVMTSSSGDFLHTLRYGGSTGVLLDGQLYTDAELVADSGIDWTQAMPVPEPGSWALMLAGLVAVGRLARRRQG